MPALLYGIGAFALFAGLVMIGFGVPINEFSFGNTLISAGTTAVVGGLILFGLGVVAGQLRRVAEALTGESPARVAQPAVQPTDILENTSSPHPTQSQGRTVLPSRSKPESQPLDLSAAFEDKLAEALTPTLRNPAETAAIQEDVSLSAPHLDRAAPAAPASAGTRDRSPSWRSPAPPAPGSLSPPIRPVPNSNFDAMWPTDTRLPKSTDLQAQPAMPPREVPASPPQRVEPEKPRAVAILKSGVVDGMGYTLYVDGSIEAELPQGTLRFASINELRSHIAKNS